MVSLEIPRLSQSRHERLKCPSSYVHSEMYGYDSTDNEYNVLGSEAHAILFNWANHGWMEKAKVTDQIHLESVLRTASHEAAEMIRHFLEGFSLDFRKIVALETRLEGGDDLEGTPDVLSRLAAKHYKITDYKSQHQVVEAESFQSKLYPLLVFLNYPDAEIVEFELAFLRYGCTRTVSYARKDMPAIMELVQASRSRQLEIHANPQQYEKQAVPGKACIYCPLLRKRECPVEGWNHMEMPIEQRLQWQEYMKRAVKANDQILKDHAEHIGPISAQSTDGRKIVGQHVPKETRQFPFGPATALLVEWKEDTGEDLIKDLHVSYSSLKAKLKTRKRAILDQAFEDIAQVEQRTEFEIREEA